jgi:hypothetical protein
MSGVYERKQCNDNKLSKLKAPCLTIYAREKRESVCVLLYICWPDLTSLDNGWGWRERTISEAVSITFAIDLSLISICSDDNSGF